MNSAKRTGYVLRDTIVDLLSDEEVSKVSTAETTVRLAEGEEFIDLQRLEDGVCQADGVLVQIGHVLPRRAVHERTWEQIVKLLAAPPETATGSRPDAFKAVRSR